MTFHLIIHPGLGKTATTYLQTHLLRRLPVLILGKGGLRDGTESHPSPKLFEAQYELFSFIGDAQGAYRRFRDSTPLVEALADQLYALISSYCHESPPKDGSAATHEAVGVWSDENILGFGGAELNLTLLSLTLAALEKRLTEGGIELQPHVVISIREQAGLLQSFFAFDFEHLRRRHRSFDRFIEFGLERPEAEIFGELHYDRLFAKTRTALGRVPVTMVPFELVVQDRTVEFLEWFFADTPLRDRRELLSGVAEAGHEPAAMNRNSSSGQNWTRGYRWWQRAMIAVPTAMSRYWATAGIYRVLRRVGYLKNSYWRSVRLFRPGRMYPVALSDRQKSGLKRMYLESNRQLSKLPSCRDIGSVGYL